MKKNYKLLLSFMLVTILWLTPVFGEATPRLEFKRVGANALDIAMTGLHSDTCAVEFDIKAENAVSEAKMAWEASWEKSFKKIIIAEETGKTSLKIYLDDKEPIVRDGSVKLGTLTLEGITKDTKITTSGNLKTLGKGLEEKIYANIAIKEITGGSSEGSSTAPPTPSIDVKYKANDTNAITTALDKNTSTVTVKLEDENNKISKNVFQKLYEKKDKTLIIEGKGYQWLIKSSDITEKSLKAVADKDIDFGVKIQKQLENRPSELVNKPIISVLSLSQSGNFPGKSVLVIPAGVEYSNKKVSLYYLKDKATAELVKTYEADKMGNLNLEFEHASDYVLVAEDNKTQAFTDIKGHWAEKFILDLSQREIVKGNNGLFKPEDTITRGEFAQILANMAKVELTLYKETPLTDIKSGDWYLGAVAWAYEKGIVTGADGKFMPMEPVTRQDMAVMIERYAKKIENKEIKGTLPKVKFEDEGEIADYSKKAVEQMQEAGIISGGDNNKFKPRDFAKRAEACKMISVMLEVIGYK